MRKIPGINGLEKDKEGDKSEETFYRNHRSDCDWNL